jgi:hypothetical protein
MGSNPITSSMQASQGAAADGAEPGFEFGVGIYQESIKDHADSCSLEV